MLLRTRMRMLQMHLKVFATGRKKCKRFAYLGERIKKARDPIERTVCHTQKTLPGELAIAAIVAYYCG